MKLYRNAALLFVVCALVVAGCTSPKPERRLSDIPLGTGYSPANVLAVGSLPAGFFRVAVLPLHNSAASESDIAGTEVLLLSRLRQAGRFELHVVEKEQMFRLIGSESISAQDPLPAALLAYLRDSCGLDGLLQWDLTAYRAYRPLMIGLRGRLLDFDSRQVLWACDEVIDAANAAVVTAARKFSASTGKELYPMRDTRAILNSPRRFTDFAAHALLETLPQH